MTCLLLPPVVSPLFQGQVKGLKGISRSASFVKGTIQAGSVRSPSCRILLTEQGQGLGKYVTAMNKPNSSEQSIALAHVHVVVVKPDYTNGTRSLSICSFSL